MESERDSKKRRLHTAVDCPMCMFICIGLFMGKIVCTLIHTVRILCRQLEINVRDDRKIVEVWLTNQEKQDEALRGQLKIFYQQIQGKEVYCGGIYVRRSKFSRGNQRTAVPQPETAGGAGGPEKEDTCPPAGGCKVETAGVGAAKSMLPPNFLMVLSENCDTILSGNVEHIWH